jgi:hypothetical protein
MLSLERRLHGDTKSVHWSPEDIERLSRHYGTRTPDGASQRRDAWSVGVPPLPLATKSDDGATRTFTISTGSIDRMGDAINPHGWHTAGYMRNPVVLWGHDYSRPPIGRATSVWREGESLKAKMVFASSSFAHSRP